MAEFTLNTPKRNVILDITGEINARIPNDMECGICHVFCPHTTAGITVNENADPAVKHDILEKMTHLIPHNETYYQHAEENSDAHLKAILTGFSLALPVKYGKLSLGTWQGVYFCEYDGPRTRKVRLIFQKAEE